MALAAQDDERLRIVREMHDQWDMRSRVELTRYAIRRGLVEP